MPIRSKYKRKDNEEQRNKRRCPGEIMT